MTRTLPDRKNGTTRIEPVVISAFTHGPHHRLIARGGERVYEVGGKAVGRQTGHPGSGIASIRDEDDTSKPCADPRSAQLERRAKFIPAKDLIGGGEGS